MSKKIPKTKNELVQMLDDIARQAEAMKNQVREENADLQSQTKELDRLVRSFKAELGLSSFDKTAYQREYMRKKRAEDPDYRPLIRGLKDMPDWRRYM